MPKLGKRARAAKAGWAKKSPKLGQSAREPRKLKQWTNESMVHAMTAVKDGEMGVNRAAEQFGVPKTTLKDRMSGRVQHGSVSGPEPYLNKEEEQELVGFLIQMAKLGYGKTKKDVISIVKRTIEKKGITTKFNGEGWWTRFKQRNDHLRLRVADPLAMVRTVCTHQEVLDEYFNLLGDTLDTLELKCKPTQIYNMDETGVPLDAKQLKRIAPKGMKKVHGRSSGNKTQITVVACGNAAGSMIPPFVIWKGERLNYELTKGEVPGTTYGMSENGWIDSELFFHWLNTHFIRHIPPTRPVLLLLDGHSTHFTPEALKESKKNDIEVLALPPHTTHQAQPLDVSFFKSLKSNWSSVCHAYMSENLGHVVTKFQFSTLFSKAWYLAIKPQTIMNGFKKTGIYPFDKNALTTADSPSSSPDTGKNALTTADSPSSSPDTGNQSIEMMDTDFNVGPSTGTTGMFTKQQIELFTERYDNEYDLMLDNEYVRWLSLSHPDSMLALKDREHDLEELDVSFTHTENVLSESMHADLQNEVIVDPGQSASPITSTPVSSADLQVEPNFDPGPSASPLTSTPVRSADLQDEPNVDPGPSASPITGTPMRSKSLSESLEATRKLHTSISNFLTIPTEEIPKKSKSRKGAKVLTSQEALSLLEEKAKQKKEEEEAKEQRKRDRELKKIEREKEKQMKAKERARKAEERLKLAERKKMEKERKDQLRKKKVTQKSNVEQGIQVGEVSSNECAISLGAYEDDIQDGKLMCSWVECTNPNCKKWMHESCLQKDSGDLLVCGICKSVFC